MTRDGWRRFAAALLAGTLIAFGGTAPGREPAAVSKIAAANLPREARETLNHVRQGGPFAYERDGAVFGNFEKRLPVHERGYYREYTVKTPGDKNRGVRRIVAGRSGELYYTDDHYRTFRRIVE
jgi:ribonuclease T1